MKHLSGAVVSILFALLITVTSWAAIPGAINYQGYLTDDQSDPVADGTYTLTFKLYSGPSETQEWSSGPQEVLVINGLFNYQLGSATAMPHDLFAADTLIRLGITVEDDDEIVPRTRLVSMPYAYQSLRADTAEVSLSGAGAAGWADDGASVRLISGSDSVGIGTQTPQAKLEVDGDTRITSNIVVGQDQQSVGSLSSIGGGKADTLLGNYCVIAGGFVNLAVEDYTTISGGHSNEATAYLSAIGGGSYNEASDTGSTVGGGSNNKAEGLYSTICGGSGNFASDTGAFVGGGTVNLATGHTATLCGGTENIATGDYSFTGGGVGVYSQGDYATACGGALVVADGDYAVVSGGNNNYVFGRAAVVPGGVNNFGTGDYSFAAGYRANANHRSCFVWADSTGSNFESSGENQFLIRASGGVGVGTDSPQGALDVSSTAGAFLVPRMTTSERDLLTAANGMIIYNTSTNQFNFYENDAWVVK